MLNQFSRTELIFGKDGMSKLFRAKTAVFGIGGVGGYTVEALARSGVGRIDLFDDDKICVTNMNRQLHATIKSIGKYKVDAAKERILEINPNAVVNTHKIFYTPDTSEQVDLSQYDYVIDAIDTVSGKIELAVKAFACGVPLISSMGAGNKINAADFEVADIYETSVCPLAKVMRHELRRRGIPRLKVVYSKEPARCPQKDVTAGCEANCVCPPGTERKCVNRRQIPGSTAFVPAMVGLIIAGEVVCQLTMNS
ncbi:MAG: tRNA threonylcarbamoyladenosine dehydratase [Oscillospiraceae bacterium]|nr:tRNA threonylcarbamoyladenosine dehydratase [Oscillospiraceae bacterium]